MALHTFVDFHADYPVPDGLPRSGDDIPGRELAGYLAARLRARGFPAPDPQPADFQYVIEWNVPVGRIEFYIGTDEYENPDRWSVQAVVVRRGLFVGRRRVEEAAQELTRTLLALHEILATSHRIRDVRWFPSFDVPEELARQAVYGGPTSDVPVWQPTQTTLSRLAGAHARLCDAGSRWLFPLIGTGILGYVSFGLAGQRKVAVAAMLLPVLAVGAVFLALGTGAGLRGLELYVARKQSEQFVSAWIGLLLFFLAGAFFCFTGLGVVWGFVQSWLRL